jgi:hypothetical protein
MCSERSGSNLITKLFNAHSEICGPSTKHLINPVARNLFRYGDLSQQNNWNALINDIYILLSAEFSIWKKEFSLTDLSSMADCGDINSLLINIFNTEAAAHNKNHLFIKENHLYEFFPFLLINFPDSKFIYQTRDPRDMAISWKKNKSHPGGIIAGAKQWAYDQKRFLSNYDTLHKVNKAFLIKYEDLIDKPEDILSAALSFLEFKFERSMLDFNQDSTTRLNAQAQDGWSNLSQPIISNNSAKFMTELTLDEISLIEKICYFEMKALNYKPINKKEGLDNIPTQNIDVLEQEEKDKFSAQPSVNVQNSMKAKQRFYQHEHFS